MGFEQGLSGLNASAKHLDTIGNNVANASTVGFKQSQAQFADMFAASLSGSGGLQIGTGTKLAAVAQQFTQGNITNTSNPLDTAISGQGFFRLTDATGAAVYSRNGQFQLDKNGFLVNNQGHVVNGYLPNANGLIAATAPVPLQLNSADLKPNMTTTAIVGANLDSRAAVPLNPVFSSIDPTSYTSSTSLSIYDSLGANHVGTLYFQRQPIVPPTFVSANTTSAVVSTVAGLAVGNTMTFSLPAPAQTATITGINAGTNTVTYAALGFAPVAGALITTNAPSSSWNTYLTVDGISVPAPTPLATMAPTTIAASTPIGATSATLVSATGLTVGSTITIAGNPGVLTIATVNTGTGAVTWTPATTATTGVGGAAVNEVTPVLAFNPPTPLTQITFDLLGKLSSTTPVSAPVGTVTSSVLGLFPGSTTVNPLQQMTFNFGSQTAGTTQFGGTFGVNTLTQNGYTSGRLNSTSTSADGTILGRYSNGQSRAMGQVVLANFTNAQGLQPVGNNEWVETSSSGGPLVGAPGSSSLGVLQSSATEDSNVDLTAELVNMITAQRVYQANAQTIKTQDQLLQTIVSLR